MIAMNGDKKFRMCFQVEPFYIFLIAVPGRVDEVFTSRAVADDTHALSGEAVFHFFYGAFVSRNNGGREDDGVSLMEREFSMSFIGCAV